MDLARLRPASHTAAHSANSVHQLKMFIVMTPNLPSLWTLIVARLVSEIFDLHDETSLYITRLEQIGHFKSRTSLKF